MYFFKKCTIRWLKQFFFYYVNRVIQPLPHQFENILIIPDSSPGLSGKESTCQCRRRDLDPWVGNIPRRRKWQPTPVFLPGKSHGQRRLAGCSPWGCKRVRHNLVTKQHHHPRKTTSNSSQTLFPSSPFCFRQPLIYSLPLFICPFWIFHMHVIIQCIVSVLQDI